MGPELHSADRSRARRYVSFLVAALSLIALICVTLLLPVPYVVLAPSPAFNTLGDFDGQPMMSFPSDVTTYKTTGKLDFTTVSVTRPDGTLTLAEALAAYYGDGSEVVRRTSIYPEGETADESQEVSELLFKGAQDAAKVVALRELGRAVPTVPAVLKVEKRFPANRVLRPGDLILAADGRKNITVSEFVQLVRSKKPGEPVQIRIDRDGKTRTVAIAPIRDPQPPHRSRIGISPVELYQPDKAMKIDFHTGSEIGGSSAGMMFALAIYDRLTPGALTGGKHIAGTGTIKVDGTVGPIGGIRQKTIGAAAGGAKIFLVPADNCADAMLDADARGRVHGMQVVRVRQYKDAIAALEKLADDPKAAVPTCDSRGD